MMKGLLNSMQCCDRGRLRLVILCAAAAGFAVPVSAQVPSDTLRARQQLEQQLGTQVTNAQVLERLRQSGMTRAQIRQRLRQAGYDPALADQYFDILERGGEPQRGAASADFIQALQRIGVSVGDSIPDDMLQLRRDSILLADSLRMLEGEPVELQVFGRNVFRGPGSQFEPLAFGPVDPDYRVGPGDELFLVLTGDVELAYTLNVSREGYVTIPDVGQVPVNGLSLAMLEDRLYDRLGRVYSGVRRGPDATTRFHVSLGRLRAIQVFVVGDVVDPGAKQLSSVSGVLEALHWAAGPTEVGSFRNIQVRRGSRLIATIDLYDYLLFGDASSDVRLEHGDRIFVPPVGPQVRVRGAVRRPAIYEVRPDREDMRDVLAFAGGLEPDAVIRRVQVDRILPPGQRSPSRYRVIRDVDVAALFDPAVPAPVEDGDVVHVLAIPDELRERVWITGAVNNPGIFEWTPGMQLEALIDRADGLAQTAYGPRLLIYRTDAADGTRSLLRTSAEPNQVTNVSLQDGDSVVVVSRTELANPGFVSIDGFVKEPGEYPFAQGMTLCDAILTAGGFIPGANIFEAEVSRAADPLIRTDTTAQSFRVAFGGVGPADAISGAGNWPPEAEELVLERGDRVFVRRAPGYAPMALVAVSGEVMYPGTYALTTRQERFTDVVQRAGWLTPEAYPGGARVVRDGTLVSVDLERAFSDPSNMNNLRLEPGDSIHVPAYDPTVAVTGAVMFSSRVHYRPGMSLSDYLSQAGGTTDIADTRRITVTYANGERAAIRRAVFGRRTPAVRPGSTIYVPVKPEDQREGFNLDQFLSRTLTILSTTVTLLIAIDRLN
jgi:polysaccharide biosynthesis/export protein